MDTEIERKARGEREVDIIIQWTLGCKKVPYVFLMNTFESLVSDTHYEQYT